MRDLVGAVEGGGTKFLCAVGSGPFDLVSETRITTRDPESTLQAVCAFFAPFASRLSGIGVSCFGPLELSREVATYGSILQTPKPGWSGAPIASLLARRLSVPVHIDTDVHGAALAERAWGAAQGLDSIAYVTVGTGVGVGVLIHGAPLHGILHPELGHILVPRAPGDDFVGSCPFHGACVEGLISAPAIAMRCAQPAHQLADDDPVWPLLAFYLARLLSAIVLAYAPQRIVLGGGVMTRPSLLERTRAELMTALNGYVPRPQLQPTEVAQYIVPAGLGERAGLLGGFALANGNR